MNEWAKREVEIAINGSKDSDGMDSYFECCCNSALKAYESLCEDGHSGYSIMATKNILNRLIDGKPLTPIEDVPEVWDLIEDEKDKKMYQNKRMSSLFKHVYSDGSVDYNDINRYYCEDIHDGMTYTNGLVNSILNEMYPITMPYMPADKRIKVVCASLLTDPKNGDFDTKAIFYIILPDGTKRDVNRFFTEPKENEEPTYSGWREIDIQEFKECYEMEYARTEIYKDAIVSQINLIETGEQCVLYADGRAVFAGNGSATNIRINDEKIVITAYDTNGNLSTITQTMDPTLEIKVEAPSITINEKGIGDVVKKNTKRSKRRGWF